MNTESHLVTIIIPAYNEAENLPVLVDRVNEVLASQEPEFRFEVILLDNASTDRTPDKAAEICACDPRWKYLRYSRNFGLEASLLAGLDHAAGDAVINLFSDLQDPPELIPEMLRLWKQGADVVYGKLTKRNDDNLLKTLGAKIAYRMICSLSDCKIVPGATDFRLMNRKVVDNLRVMREPDRYMRGLVHWVGYKQVPLVYERARRTQGESSAKLYYCIKFALHAVICFSSKPLQIVTLFGLAITGVSMLLGMLYMVLYFARPSFLAPPPPGITTIFLMLLFMIGSNALFLGIIGAYIGRIYNQGKGRVLYIVDKKINFQQSPL